MDDSNNVSPSVIVKMTNAFFSCFKPAPQDARPASSSSRTKDAPSSHKDTGDALDSAVSKEEQLSVVEAAVSAATMAMYESNNDGGSMSNTNDDFESMEKESNYVGDVQAVSDDANAKKGG